jgi:hypothetical protein
MLWLETAVLVCMVVVVICNWIAMRQNKVLKQENLDLKTIVADKNELIQALKEENKSLKVAVVVEENIVEVVVEEEEVIEEQPINPFEAVTIYDAK